MVVCLAAGWAGCHARVQWVAIVVGRECCVRLFKSLKRLKSFFSLRCYAAESAVLTKLAILESRS